LRAAAAHRQGRFWPLHDALMAHGGQLAGADLDEVARAAGVELDRMHQDMRDPTLLADVTRQQAALLGLGAVGTPVVFVNGSPVQGARPWAELDQVVTRQRDAVLALEASGSSRAEAIREVSRRSHPQGDRFVRWILDGEPPAGP
jgi:protein-disulfide isomerase